MKIISLGIGDTTEPIPAPIITAMKNYADGLGTLKGYSGYGAEQGMGPLREVRPCNAVQCSAVVY